MYKGGCILTNTYIYIYIYMNTYTVDKLHVEYLCACPCPCVCITPTAFLRVCAWNRPVPEANEVLQQAQQRRQQQLRHQLPGAGRVEVLRRAEPQVPPQLPPWSGRREAEAGGRLGKWKAGWGEEEGGRGGSWKLFFWDWVWREVKGLRGTPHHAFTMAAAHGT